MKAVILAGGLGQRLRPLTGKIPKPLLPILNRPIMEHQIEHMKQRGIRDVILVVGHLKELVQEHFGDGSRLGVSIRYVEQRETLGIAHAVMQLERHLEGAFRSVVSGIETPAGNDGDLQGLEIFGRDSPRVGTRQFGLGEDRATLNADRPARV